MTEWLKRVNEILQPSPEKGIMVLDLFCGCGGLSLGFEAAGFSVTGYDADKSSVETANRNLRGQTHCLFLSENLKYPAADVIIGGPPCQPFSKAGKRRGSTDQRNGFPAFVSAVRQSKPKVWLFENVEVLIKDPHFTLVLSDLGKDYNVDYRVLDASKHGVPQKRKRVFAVGFKKPSFHWPPASDKVVTVHDAVSDLMSQRHDKLMLTPSMDAYIEKYEKASKCINPRDLNPDKPARTLTCRNLYGATGDMHRVRMEDGSRRQLTVREAARLQSFPDWFEFPDSRSNAMKQIGNAVPPLLSLEIAQSVAACF